MKTVKERLQIAEEVINRCDTVVILSCAEADDIRRRALEGEYDHIFDGESNPLRTPNLRTTTSKFMANNTIR